MSTYTHLMVLFANHPCHAMAVGVRLPLLFALACLPLSHRVNQKNLILVRDRYLVLATRLPAIFPFIPLSQPPAILALAFFAASYSRSRFGQMINPIKIMDD